MVSLVFYVTLFYHVVLLHEIPGTWVIFLLFSLCQHLCWSNICTHMPAALSSIFPCSSYATVFSAWPCSSTCIIHVPFIALPSMSAISSLSEQNSCRCFYNSAYIDGQPQGMSCNSMSMYSLSSIANYILSALMQSGMSVHDLNTLLIMYMPGISLSLSVSWLCMESQSTMNSCGPGLHNLLILYLCILNIIHWKHVWWVYSTFLGIFIMSNLWLVIIFILWVKQ